MKLTFGGLFPTRIKRMKSRAGKELFGKTGERDDF